MFRYVCCLAVLLAIAAGVRANPDFAQDVWYYDEEGNVIGWYSVTCSGIYSDGDTSDIYEVITGGSCAEPPVTMPTCGQQGLYTLSGCGDYYCYSQSYVMSFNSDMVYNCVGICSGGEGPGAGGNKWCNTCYKGTGSCPTAGPSRPKRKPRPTLRAALDAKLLEILAPLRPRG
jgi:hypothetical protein